MSKKLPFHQSIDTSSFLEKNAWVIVGILTCIAFFIRIYRLDFHSFWVDEYTHALYAKAWLQGTGSFFGGEFNQVIVTMLNACSAAVFGLNDYACKFPLVVLSVAGIPLVFLFAKKLYNTPIALLSATLFSFSQFYTFWSRINRSYGMVATFYFFLILMLWFLFETKPQRKQPSIFERLQLNYRYFYWFFFAFVLALITQVTIILFFFSFGCYTSIIFINNVINKKENAFKDKYAIIAYINCFLLLILFTPLSTYTVQVLVSYLVNPMIAEAVSPNWTAIFAKFQTKDWNKALKVYTDVTIYDLKNFYWLGWLGFILAFFVNKKSSVFLCTLFFVPLILMSFILRGLTWERYMAFFYPTFFIAGSATIYVIAFVFLPKIQIIQRYVKAYIFLIVSLILLCVYSFLPLSEIHAFITTEKQGRVIDEHLSPLTVHVPWNQACEYIKPQLKENDIVLSSHVENAMYYLQHDSVFLCRQQRVEKFQSNNLIAIEKNQTVLNQNNALTFENFLHTYNRNQRGWIILDNAFFHSGFIDSRVAQFCIDSMYFHYGITTDGLLKVFSWDHHYPKKSISPFLIHLGSLYDDMLAYKEIGFQFPAHIGLAKKIVAHIKCEGIDINDEAVLLVNGRRQISLSSGTITSKELVRNNIERAIEYRSIEVNKNDVQAGANSFVFLQGGESNGYVIYNFSFSIQ